MEVDSVHTPLLQELLDIGNCSPLGARIGEEGCHVLCTGRMNECVGFQPVISRK